LIIAFMTTAISGHRVAAVTSLAVGYASFLWLPHLTGTEAPPTVGGALGLGTWLLVLFTVSEIARSRREHMLQRARMDEEETMRRASEERLRIARELHDVLAHTSRSSTSRPV
jgi:signal transduction histidine kinase